MDHGRRRLLASTTALAGAYILNPISALADTGLPGDGRPFSFDGLVAHARTLAGRAYQPPVQQHEKLLDDLGYETFMGIHARRDKALWADADTPVMVEFFHLDQNARVPVTIHTLDDGRAHKIDYASDLFRYEDPKIAERVPDDLGFAGFRLVNRDRKPIEWLAFKGASYFRSPGALNQYGLSARGLAVDTGYGEQESFPRFSNYWLVKPAPGDTTLTIYALLEGEHVTGAYRMRVRRPGDLIMDIEARLFQRDPIRRLGIAPLTSMFWFSETNARRGVDWRPEVHDSDGLAMTTGRGERLWRALSNPPRVQYSVFSDHNPRGFGLLQRDRAFDHYQDPAVGFEKRPSLWVEPRGDWGDGHVGLLELPTDEEVYDNINAFWVPATPAAAGHEWRFDYRLFWTGEQPYPPKLARVVSTRTGRAGQPGTYQDQSVLARKFVIDFSGAPLTDLGDDAEPKPQVSASHGRIDNPYVQHVKSSGRWRIFFDWKGELPPDDTPVELRAAMSHDADVITETWLYAYYPQALPRRLPAGDDSDA